MHLRPDHPGANRSLAFAALAEHRTGKARELLARSENITPTSGRAHALVAEALAQRGRIEESMPHYERALELGPRHPALLATIYGERLEEIGRCKKAENWFQRALETRPHFERAREGLRRCEREPAMAQPEAQS